jgi:fructose-1,6-bisphosphatase I
LQQVLSIGEEPSVFTLDPSLGEFVLTQPRVRLPSRGKIFSINEGNASLWDAGTAAYVHQCKFPGGGGDKKPKSARYVGSMVADVHRTLLYGGVFLYPADTTSKRGKLRLLYECYPMAYVLERAGGRASSGSQAILDIAPTSIHERCPIFLGSAEDVADVEAAIAADGASLQI